MPGRAKPRSLVRPRQSARLAKGKGSCIRQQRVEISLRHATAESVAWAEVVPVAGVARWAALEHRHTSTASCSKPVAQPCRRRRSLAIASARLSQITLSRSSGAGGGRPRIVSARQLGQAEGRPVG